MSLVDLPAQAIQCSMTGVSADCGDQLTAKVDQMVRMPPLSTVVFTAVCGHAVWSYFDRIVRQAFFMI